MEDFLAAAVLVLDPLTLGMILIGTAIGLIFGAIPGLTYTVALALVLPLTFGLPALPSIGLLLGTYIGGMTGGAVSSILLGIPGTPTAAATVLDGYPMTQQGKGALALGAAVIVSVFGGLFSLVLMVLSVDLVSRIAISFGPAEIFALVVFGLSTICGLAGTSMIKGLIAGVLGLMVMTIGLDALEGVPRMTFGSVQMLQGVNMIVAMIGLFAVPFIIRALLQHWAGVTPAAATGKIKVQFPSLGYLFANWWLIIRSSLIGTGIGAIPGTGGPIASFLAYDSAKRFSKDKSKFGKGDLRGVIGPETAGNAVIGGAMIPLLSLGIPGDPATALVLAGMQIQGLVPGPALFLNNRIDVYGIYIIIMVSLIMLFFLQLLCIRLFVHVLRVPQQLMAVVIVVLCGVGAYAFRNSIFDIYSVAIVGVAGFLLVKAGIPTTPLVLGLVLGPTLESNYRTAMNLSGGDYGVFYTSPAAVVFFLMALLVVVLQIVGTVRKKPEPVPSVG
ncbi:tripartite tricarboxylate transporter permease [Devosia naphthalenivorans]|uniref:tripartite tricarboxylate transporter permease n=1 Tax=Devosia naphthalenivorans TaxID=2082392 RepID=UPI000D3C680F|nr:tripartite tricarboxylate transporter permease [Devosia naphthalenivorans]